MRSRKAKARLEEAIEFVPMPQCDHSVLPALCHIDGLLYAPLDTASKAIRLLELMPDGYSVDGLFYCKLIPASLEHRPHFNAET
jgi:hypothetical protein